MPRPRVSHILGIAVRAAALAALALPPPAAGQLAPVKPATVGAVLFYSPTCPHCREVISTHLPPLKERYGDRFQIVGVDVTTPRGTALYNAAVEFYGLAPDRLGVPLMIVGDVTLLGSQEIPDRLLALLEEGLAAGGTPWPALPELREALAAQGVLPQEAEPLTTSLTPGSDAATPPSTQQLFLQDPVGNGIAVATLVALLGTLVVGVLALRPQAPPLLSFPGWTIPVLATAGLGIASYLAGVEVTGAHAVCGPVGDCNTVQQSPYAVLLGVPVGILGAVGYLAMAAAWAMATFGPATSRRHLRTGLWAMAFAGTIFSVYLTFLEPFVIGATCAWCVASALIMATLLLAATHEVRQAS